MNWFYPPPSQSLCRLLRELCTAILAVFLLSSIKAEQAPASMGSIEQMWAEASAAQQSQQYDRAADLYRKILSIQPNLTEAEVNLGIMLHLAGKPQEAVACFDHVLSKHPDLLGLT